MAVLKNKMSQMVDEANSLRGEAAEKLYDVPKAYNLVTMKSEIRSCFLMFMAVALSLGFLSLFMWSLTPESEDVAHITVAIVCTVLIVAGMMWASVMKSQPYKPEEHEQVYYVNNLHYGLLQDELKRLKHGIADYDRQYAEQEEYILKFREYYQESEDFGGRLELVLKANDFHAHVTAKTDTDEIDCRLKFDQTGYEHLVSLVEILNGKAA